MRTILCGDNLQALERLPERFARLVYIDPPFNTGKTQRRDRIRVTRNADGERRGFGGARYSVERLPSASYRDSYDDYIGFVMQRIERSIRCMTEDASLFVHVDPRESHYLKIALDELFGRDSFMNEIVWSYDFGGRSKRRWSPKHDVIFWYARDPKNYIFNYDAIDRIPYMAPSLVGPEKAARGKTPTDVWWHTIVPTSGREKTGYPTQKPLGILERIVKVHSMPGDVVLDFFAGSGTTGEAAAKNGRGFVLVDQNPEAIEVMQKRLAQYEPEIRTLG
ncbi:MAG: site-specific DNA-methyltransferase [Sandaracinaceae bacterium]|nr:site-specific DNA-methyltransferase [Sandaracinaceae bacterium]